MVVIARVHALQDRGDRDRIEAGVVALIELAAEIEDGLRGERILAGRVVLDDPAAGRGTREWLALRILELGEPLHVGQPIAHGLEAVLEGEGADRRGELQFGDVAGRTLEKAAAAERSLEAIRVDAGAAVETRIRCQRDSRRVDVRAGLPRRQERSRGLRAAGGLADRDVGRPRDGRRRRRRAGSRSGVASAEEDREHD